VKESEPVFDVVRSGQAERDAFSKVASDNTRKLCFVGFALIALFGGMKQSTFTFPLDLPSRLMWTGLLLALALAADLLQYVYAAVAFGVLARIEEKKPQAHRRSHFPAQINWMTNVFFVSKIVLTIIGWILLIIHLADNLK
jgi:hypothetical protein